MKKITREVKALTFDVFGTVVDWRGSITAEGRSSDGRRSSPSTGSRSRMPGAPATVRRWTACGAATFRG